MKPRLNSSKKWTAFPKDYLQQIEDVFMQNFAAQLGDAKLIIEGRIYTEEILLRVGFQEKGRLAQPNFEVSMTYKQKEADAIARIHNCIDAAANMMNEYFETDGEAEFPLSWQEFEFDGRKVCLQFTTENSSLEAEANKLLGQEFNDLLTEEPPTDDALDLADEKIKVELEDEDETEDSDDEEFSGPAKPTLFSGKAAKKKKTENIH